MIYVYVLNNNVVEMSNVKVWHSGENSQVNWVVYCSNPYAVLKLWRGEYFNVHFFGVYLNNENNKLG